MSLISFSQNRTLPKVDLKTLENILEKSFQNNEILEEVVVSYKIAGLDVIKSNELKNSSLIYKNNYVGLNQAFSLNFRPHLITKIKNSN